MSGIGYSYKPKNEDRVSRAIGKEIRASPKFSFEVCNEIRGKKLSKAEEYLEDVIAMKKAVPIRRYNKGVSHRKGLKNVCAGRFPVKVSSNILKVLKVAKANAEYKGLDTERLYIRHISAMRGRIIKGIRPRAFGKASASNTPTTNVEVILEER
jgi:large subunit ribosomal protein L22